MVKIDLIDNERNTPYPYTASGAPAETPRSAYDLLKIELAYFMQNHFDKTGRMPDDAEMQLEACRIVFASEILSIRELSSPFSWLRDLIMSSEDIMKAAKFGPLRAQAENRLSTLRISGKDTLFESCRLESGLQEFVRAKRLLGLTAMDDELQEEAAQIISEIESISVSPSDFIANWLVKLIFQSTSWLANFRQRAHLPRTEDIVNENERSTDTTKIDSTIHNYSRLERSLADYMNMQIALGADPANMDADLQRQARIIIYEFDDGWNQTAADNLEWLSAFKQRNLPASVSGSSLNTSPASQTPISQGGMQFSVSGTSPSNVSANASNSLIFPPTTNQAMGQTPYVKTSPFFMNDANCYSRLSKSLKSYVNSVHHIPSDSELQHQARLLLYNDDDQWNQTAADNAEWLQRFKRDVGIIKEPGPGLPEGDSWSISQGGTGFAPPYAFPGGNMAPFSEKSMSVSIRDSKVFETDTNVLNKYLETFKTRYAKPATIFCARELEDGLVKFVEMEMAITGRFPDDDALRAQARLIINTATTAADDPTLLGKFKDWMMTKEQQPEQQQAQQAQILQPQPRLPPSNSALPTGMDLTLSDAEMNDILQGMHFDDFSAADLDMGMGMGPL